MRDAEGGGNFWNGARDGDGAAGGSPAAPSKPFSASNGHALAAEHSAGHTLITGGAGFIGTNVAAAACARGEHVLVFDNLARPGVQRNLDWLRRTFGGRLRFVPGDVRDAAAVQQAVRSAGKIFHFAAQVAVTTSLEQPREDFEVNALGTLNVLEACRQRADPPPLLFTSTNKVYGDLGGLQVRAEGERYVPMDAAVARHGVGETLPLDFHSPYGCSKGTADQYVLDYARCYGLPATVFRMSCVYGPHQCGTADQGWVAHFAREVLRGRPITFYGDGRQVRDLLFVNDLVTAMEAALAQLDRCRGRAFNMGGGVGNALSLRDVVALLAQRSDRRPTVSHDDWRAGDQRYYVSDTRAFTAVTGWKPRTSVAEGIDQLCAWLATQQRSVSTAAV